MTEPGDLPKNMPDWVVPEVFDVEGDLPPDEFERVVKAGYQIERDGDNKKTRVVGRVIIKGDTNKDSLNVTK